MRDFEARVEQPIPDGLSLHGFSLGKIPHQAVHLDIHPGEILWVELPNDAIRSQWLDIFSFQKGTFNGAFSFLEHRVTPNMPLQDLLLLKEKMQAVFSNPLFVEEWPAIANLTLPLRLQSIPQRYIEQRCHEAIKWAEAEKWMYIPVCELSNFQRLELNWLKALIAYPRFLLIHAQTLPYDDFFSEKISATLENISSHGNIVMIIATKMDRMIHQFWHSRLPKLDLFNLPD
ncbi:hypothetical protein FAI41_02325 [Acetobacteraceae bacterium]|nr:hypothetical protein FAI41_02325 [Acetobacteraceae bacterium]